MPTPSELWPTVTGSDVLIWAALDRKDTTRRIALYKNRAGITGRLTAKQLYALGETIESLPVVKPAKAVAAALRVGYPPQFRWDYFDFILSSTTEAQDAALADAVQQAVSKMTADLLDAKNELVAEIATQVASVFRYRGSVQSLEDLPTENNVVGDVYQVVDEEYSEYCWIEPAEGAHWEYLGKIIDLSPYLEKSEYNAYVAANDARVANLETSKQQRFANVFVREESSLNLEVSTKYYLRSTLSGTLTANANDGDELVIVVFDGGRGSVITPAEGVTINGSTDPMAFNASVHQTTFVFDAPNSNWIAY